MSCGASSRRWAADTRRCASNPQAGVESLVRANPWLQTKLQLASVEATLPSFFPAARTTVGLAGPEAVDRLRRVDAQPPPDLQPGDGRRRLDQRTPGRSGSVMRRRRLVAGAGCPEPRWRSRDSAAEARRRCRCDRRVPRPAARGSFDDASRRRDLRTGHPPRRRSRGLHGLAAEARLRGHRGSDRPSRADAGAAQRVRTQVRAARLSGGAAARRRPGARCRCGASDGGGFFPDTLERPHAGACWTRARDARYGVSFVHEQRVRRGAALLTGDGADVPHAGGDATGRVWRWAEPRPAPDRPVRPAGWRCRRSTERPG